MRIRRRAARCRHGTTAAEAAVTLPLFLTLVLGIADFARLGWLLGDFAKPQQLIVRGTVKGESPREII